MYRTYMSRMLLQILPFALYINPVSVQACKADHAYLTYLMLQQQLSQIQSHITTESQSVGKSWCRAPSGAHDQIFVTV
jgi:hypothetical protein